jgi:hypothetical protein
MTALRLICGGANVRWTAMAAEAAWLTRKEAAELLRISPRHLDRLPLPRSYAAGPRSPRFARDALQSFMQGATVQPERQERVVLSASPARSRIDLSGLGGRARTPARGGRASCSVTGSVQSSNRVTEVFRREMGVSLRHAKRAVSQQLADLKQGNAPLH